MNDIVCNLKIKSYVRNKNLEKQVTLFDYYWELKRYNTILINGHDHDLMSDTHLFLENRDSLIFEGFTELHHLNNGGHFSKRMSLRNEIVLAAPEPAPG